MSEPGNTWPNELPVSRTRVARAVSDLEQTRRFYGSGVGLSRIGSFSGHAGYPGVLFGLPGFEHQLEFTEDEFEERRCSRSRRPARFVLRR